MRLLTLLFCWLYTALSWAEPQTPVVVGYYEFPPYMWTDEKGQAQGPLIEMTDRVLEESGYERVYRSLPSARMYKGLRDGSIHLWPGTGGKAELRGYTLEGQSLLGDFTLALFYRPDMPEPKIPESLKDKDLISILGYTFSPMVKQILTNPELNIRLHRTSNREAGLAMLLRKRGDYLLDYQEPVEQTSRQLGLPALPYVVMQEFKGQMIVSRRAPNSKQLLENLDRSLNTLISQGVISPISFD